MKVVLQRVSSASVHVEEQIIASINTGLVILVGIEDEDNSEDIVWLSGKIINLRIFDDEALMPNLSVKDIGGDILLVSQFTLQASVKKGNRPSYIKAAKPNVAIPKYDDLIKQLENDLEKAIQTGKFGADMKVSLINEGPMTILIDTKNRE